MDRPLAKIDENCDCKICAHWARETPKKPLNSSLPYKRKKSELVWENSAISIERDQKLVKLANKISP